MSNNHNYNSRLLIKNWYDRSGLELESNYSPFDKFICLWISFNCFFVSEFYRDISKTKKDPTEKKYLDYFVKAQKYSDIYNKLLKNPMFKGKVSNLKQLLNTITHFKGRIADMRPGHLKFDDAKPLDNEDNFEQVIKVIYQIRCNLFHGNKSPEHDGDVRLVDAAYEILHALLNEIYKIEGYIND
jgi:hypothetical protein